MSTATITRTQTRGHQAAQTIARCVDAGQPFETGGSMSGEPSRAYGMTTGHMPRNEAKRLRRHAEAGRVDYIIWSYWTPIAYRLIEDQHPTNGRGDERAVWVVPNVSYSPTTAKHQSITRWALAMTGTPVSA